MDDTETDVDDLAAICILVRRARPKQINDSAVSTRLPFVTTDATNRHPPNTTSAKTTRLFIYAYQRLKIWLFCQLKKKMMIEHRNGAESRRPHRSACR
jgi:hypothetical protein